MTKESCRQNKSKAMNVLVFRQLIDVQTDLQQTYSEATVDVYTEDATGNTSVVKLKLEPDLTKIMTEGGHSDYLLAAWWAWRNATGPQMRDQYSKMVRLLNRGAKENGKYITGIVAEMLKSIFSYFPVIIQNTPVITFMVICTYIIVKVSDFITKFEMNQRL